MELFEIFVGLEKGQLVFYQLNINKESLLLCGLGSLLGSWLLGSRLLSSGLLSSLLGSRLLGGLLMTISSPP